MRRFLIAGNWKMNNTVAEAALLTQEISNNYEKYFDEMIDVALCPPAIDIKTVAGILEFDRRGISVGAQNVYFEEKGAYTGEISVKMISEAGCDYCIVGHSERRELFKETNDDINNKVRALVEYVPKKMTPILCIGEPSSIRESGGYIDYINKQIEAALAGIDIENGNDIVLAYEPIWAIGTGKTATPEQAEEVACNIRQNLKRLYGSEISEKVRILYGGSMNEGNAYKLLAQPNIDGGLIGGASLKANSFIDIIKTAVQLAEEQ